MGRGLKIALGVGVVGIVALLGVAGGGYAYVGSAAASRLDTSWPDVKGQDLPVPYPLTEAELEELREEKRAEMAEGDEAPEPAEGEEAPDLLEGVDLEAIAMKRAVARGAELATLQLGCVECHGEDGGGKLVADAQPVWTWYAPNITSGGLTKDYTVADFDRIIRHGIKKDGTSATMPAIDFMRLPDRDVSDLAAWVMSLDPIEEPQPPTVIGPVGKALIGLGQMPIAAEMIDHEMTHVDLPPDAGVSEEYGQYVVQTCVGCHRLDYSGGPIAQGPPDWPPAGNLTPHEEGLAGWSKDDWMSFWKTGKRPDGTEVSPPMADMVGKMDPVRAEAMFVYLQTIEARPTPQ